MKILQKYNSFLEFYQKHKNHKLNDYNLLIEVKEFVQQNEIRWTISKNHVNLLGKWLVFYVIEQIRFKY